VSKVQILSHKKNGKWKGKQRYKCNHCGYVFENKRRLKADLIKSLWDQYANEKQTYDSLAKNLIYQEEQYKEKLVRLKLSFRQ